MFLKSFALFTPGRYSGLAAALTLATTVACAPKADAQQTDFGEIALRVAEMLEDEHYLRQPFDDTMSERLLDIYIEYLDYSRVYFTQEDVDRFYDEYRTTLDDAIRNRDIGAAYDIYGIYKERVRSRVTLLKDLLEKKGEFPFDSERKVEISRKDLPWPADAKASDALWHDLVEGELLQETLRQEAAARAEREEKGEKKEIRPLDDADPQKLPKSDLEPEATPDPQSSSKQGSKLDSEVHVVENGPGSKDKKAEEKKETPREIIEKRYDRVLDSVNGNDAEDVAVMFIKSLSRAYDPHSEYFSQSQYDNFRIQMNKSLEGIGAMLQAEEDGTASIQGLVVGGPAHKAGELQVMDRIVGVGQDSEGDITDTIDMKLNDVVDLIRGEKGSIVRLKVIPAEAPDGSKTKIISIVRDKVDLKDSLASAELIITRDDAGNPLKLGWINLLSFYSDMDGGNTSTTADVQRLLNRLVKEGMQGLVVDLRDNGGGSLEEAINMTGLFIPRGPVVQSRDWRGQIDYKTSLNRDAVWAGPMAVLTNRSSASASEIFAAALQDYNRALIIGEKSTFGKGTVQQLRQVLTSRLLIPFRAGNEQNGALKLTIQTFFRIDGTSTQLHGVIPHVHLPSTNDVLDIGEAALTHPLQVDPIPPQPYELVNPDPFPVDILQARTDARMKENQEFQYIREDIEDARKRIEENVVSLNRAVRESEAADLEEKRETRKEERIARFAKTREAEKDLFTVYALTQDNVHQDKLVLRDDISLEESSGMMMGNKNKEEDPEAKALEYPHGFDPYKRETINIIEDLIFSQVSDKPLTSAINPPAQAKN
ncbi:MAG: carboxy terminal-processing peptidase [Verrucomicrobiae bacterium]|nr:carboxy terminal-processing peptidase [Verrucomicrobiae bacterium]